MEEKINKPGDSDFKQQRLKGWQLSLSSLALGIVYVVIGVFFIVFGAIIIVESNKVHEHVHRYDDLSACKASWSSPPTCTISLDLSSDFESPVYVYYEIHNMYQNHRRYSKSRDIYQLMGEKRSKKEVKESCLPVLTMDDLGFYTDLELDGDHVANPCGLVPKSVFNDTFSLTHQASGKQIHIKQTDIAWPSDKDEKFSHPDDWRELQWTNVKDEHFIVWMSTAGLPNFRKLWGKIEDDLDSGKYLLTIVNNYDVSDFDGHKLFVLGTTGNLGGKVGFMGILYLIVGCLSLVGSGIMFSTHYLKKKTENVG